MNEPIGVGLVGLGFMGRTHAGAYAAAARVGAPVRLVAAYDPREDVAERAGARGNLDAACEDGLASLARARSLEALLADPDVDLVSVCTPTDLHVEHALAALAAGKHVLVEKPVALRAEDVERLADAAHAAGRVCMPAMCVRFWPGWTDLVEAVADGRHGRVLGATFRRLGARPDWSADFYGDARRSGGALFDLHVHDADLVRVLFGAPEAVSSAGTLDHVTTLYHFADGPAHVVAEGGWDASPGFPFRMSYVVVFERATYDYDLARDPALQVTRDGRTEPRRLAPGTGYDGEVRHLIRALSEGRAPGPTLEQAAALTRMLAAERGSLGNAGERVRV